MVQLRPLWMMAVLIVLVVERSSSFSSTTLSHRFRHHPPVSAATSSSWSFCRILSRRSWTKTSRRLHRHTVGGTTATTATTDIADTEKSLFGNENENVVQESTATTIRPIHQNWWPVASLGSLDPTRPNAVELLNQKLVLFQSNATSTTTTKSLNDDAKNDDAKNDDESMGWSCLDDRCSHRFAPLSEGRIVPLVDGSLSDMSSSSSSTSSMLSSTCSSSCPSGIQCAYHGWSFDANGSCQRVPQLVDDNSQRQDNRKGQPNRNVVSYPVKVKAGMVFVWADPDSYEILGRHHVPLVVPDIAQAAYDLKGDIAVFQRDLPYGYELLGENLLDLSHLPFSHHSVGGLHRSMGGPLPFRMLSETQKSSDGPLYEVDLPNAARYDPTFLGLAKMRGPDVVPANATLRIGFYQPNHVRYTRTLIPGNSATTSYVILYLCPTATARSRVFLLNVFGVPPPPPPPPTTKERENDESKESKEPAPINDHKTMTIRQRFHSFKVALLNLPSMAKQRFQARLMAYFLARNPTLGHELSHQIFDGDGVFLHKQGDRMQRRGLTYMDYETPTSSDVLVNAFRRYLTVAASKTVATKGNGRMDDLARAALPSSVVKNKGGDDAVDPTMYYHDNLPRSVLLDRYETHTKHCPICRSTLERGRQKERRWKTLQTVLTGAAGASATVTVLLLFAAGAAGAARGMISSGISTTTTTTTVSRPLFDIVGLVAAGLTAITTGGAVGASQLQRRIQKKNQKFIFEDWVHAENE